LRAVSRFPAAVLLVCASAFLAGCFDVESPDLFLLTRTGSGQTLTLLVNSGGTIKCNGGPVKPLPDKLLLVARDLATTLGNDASKKLHIPRTANTVDMYSVRLPQGTVTFPDTAGRRRSELAQTELFTVQAAQQGCELSG
jgi:hypothetical protein